MIDFAKLRNRTPEERQAAAVASDLADQQRLRIRIAERRGKILGLIAVMDSLTTWEKDFVADMEKRLREESISGIEHESLLDLSDNQVAMLNRIFQERAKPDLNERSSDESTMPTP